VGLSKRWVKYILQLCLHSLCSFWNFVQLVFTDNWGDQCWGSKHYISGGRSTGRQKSAWQ